MTEYIASSELDRAAAEDLADPLVLVGLEPELGVRLLAGRASARVRDGVGHAVASTEFRTPVKNRRPSADGPVSDSTACSGCGIRPTTLPRSLRMPAMSRRLPFGLTLDVAGDDPALALELVERALVGDEAALAVLQRDDDLLADLRSRRSRPTSCSRCAGVWSRQTKCSVSLRVSAPGSRCALAEDLEAVADAEHRQPLPRRVDDRVHHRREPGDGAAAQVVAVGEPAGQHDRVDTVQVVVAVPECDRLAAGERARRVRRPGRRASPGR